MKKLFDIDVFSNQGKRENNEDSYFPNDDIHTDLDNLFLVCDGVGGHDKGEIASDLCCTQLNAYFSNNKVEVSNEAIIDDAVSFLETKFDSYMKDNPESINMASTITLLHLHKQGATVSHMGDSRVYHFRDGKILFRTKDHSLVQELCDAGIITKEEMATHRDRNRISRAMRGASIKSYKADTSILTDLKAGDIFFLCSDGVLEAFSDEELSEVFSTPKALATLGAKIVGKCAQESSDNYTGVMVKLTEAYINSLEIEHVVTPKEEISEKKESKIGENQYVKEEQNKTVLASGTKTYTEEIDEHKEDKQVKVTSTQILDARENISKKTEIENNIEEVKISEVKKIDEFTDNEDKEIAVKKETPVTNTAPFNRSSDTTPIEDKLKKNVEEEIAEEVKEKKNLLDILNGNNKKIMVYVLIVTILAITLYLILTNIFSSNREEKIIHQQKQVAVWTL